MRSAHLAVCLGILGCSGGPSDDTDAPVAEVFGCQPATWKAPPACGTGPVARHAVIPGPAEAGHDASLAAAVRKHDRLFTALFSATTGVNTEVVVPVDDADGRAAIQAFVDGDGWDLAAVTGKGVHDVGATWQKAAGGYAGVGIAADAFRYGVLRDEGADCAEVDAARAQLLAALDGLHRASAITGVPGVIARGYARLDEDSYGSHVETVPLFDEGGNPLPAEKDNGTWRADNSGGEFPDYAWEDSCSRDMLVGWAVAYGGAWEVIRRDPTIADDVKSRMQADAAAIARSLMQVGDQGYDLEIHDADGRVTFHGVLNEHGVERTYVQSVQNGPYALMSLGIVSALVFVAEDAELATWLDEQLIAERRLHEIARDKAALVDFGLQSNFSNYNMDFAGGVLAQRYLCDDEARAAVASALDEGHYDIPGGIRQPAEQGQSLYDVVVVLARLGSGAFQPAVNPVDTAALESGLTTLREFPEAPFWAVGIENCDASEIEAGVCEAIDGSTITLASDLGRGDVLVAEEPVPMSIRPPSNYYWRSNPYQVNGDGDGSGLYPAVDLRIAYWLGRWAETTPRD